MFPVIGVFAQTVQPFIQYIVLASVVILFQILSYIAVERVADAPEQILVQVAGGIVVVVADLMNQNLEYAVVEQWETRRIS